jgi:hypothetical protein
MLAANRYPDFHLNLAHPNLVMPNHELLEVHRTKISLHHAKTDYNYPTIRLPHRFSVLAGLHTQIYQTVRDGMLAFLVVIPSATALSAGEPEDEEQAFENPESSVFTRRQ